MTSHTHSPNAHYDNVTAGCGIKDNRPQLISILFLLYMHRVQQSKTASFDCIQFVFFRHIKVRSSCFICAITLLWALMDVFLLRTQFSKDSWVNLFLTAATSAWGNSSGAVL